MKVIIDWGAEKLADGAQAIALSVVKGIVKVSYWPCLFVCIGGILFYSVGIKKGSKASLGAAITYILLQALKMAMM